MNTENKIISLLKEPTAKHFLDSGGTYGYRFEKNAKRNFKKEKEVVTEPKEEWEDITNECSISGGWRGLTVVHQDKMDFILTVYSDSTDRDKLRLEIHDKDYKVVWETPDNPFFRILKRRGK